MNARTLAEWGTEADIVANKVFYFKDGAALWFAVSPLTAARMAVEFGESLVDFARSDDGFYFTFIVRGTLWQDLRERLTPLLAIEAPFDFDQTNYEDYEVQDFLDGVDLYYQQKEQQQAMAA